MARSDSNRLFHSASEAFFRASRTHSSLPSCTAVFNSSRFFRSLSVSLNLEERSHFNRTLNAETSSFETGEFHPLSPKEMPNMVFSMTSFRVTAQEVIDFASMRIFFSSVVCNNSTCSDESTRRALFRGWFRIRTAHSLGLCSSDISASTPIIHDTSACWKAKPEIFVPAERRDPSQIFAPAPDSFENEAPQAAL